MTAARTDDLHRGLLLAMAVFLVVAGLAVPHLDDESLSTILSLAGTGLAAVLLWCPWQLAHTNLAARDAYQPTTRARAANKADKVARFNELLVQPKLNTVIERAAWAKLTSSMSHELRTPLNAVLGFSEMMSNEVFGPLGSSCYSAYARDIHASGRLLLKSAEDALAITALLTAPDRKGAGPTSQLASIAEDACNFAQHDLGLRSIEISADIDRNVDVIGDSQAVRQILINLLAEAARNAQNGAALSISTACTRNAVTLSVCVAAGDIAATADEESFTMVLARTLCELSGAELTFTIADDGSRTWTVDFLPVAQNDLFVVR